MNLLNCHYEKSFDKVNEIEVLDSINKLNNTDSSCIDEIPNKALKVVKHIDVITNRPFVQATQCLSGYRLA